MHDEAGLAKIRVLEPQDTQKCWGGGGAVRVLGGLNERGKGL